MNADSDKIRASLADQLSSFDDRLEAKADDVQMLAEIQEGIGRLLAASGGNEAEVRRVLQERYEAGELRKETFQLVKSMLDRFVTERVPTSPDNLSTARPPKVTAKQRQAKHKVPDIKIPDDKFGSTTTILPSDAFKKDAGDERVQIGSVLRDRFMLKERVSGGSMGVVYKALDRRLAEAGSSDPWVAIKVLSPQLSRDGAALRALQQEAAKGRCLTHANIVRFIDLDREDDVYFIVMEWLDGQPLSDILDSTASKTMNVDRAFSIVRQIGKALDYAHRCGIIHADVKPANVMMMPNGDAKLFDFGVARVRQKQAKGKDGFDPGVLGAMTPAYSSMQVLTGDDPVAADDVFSLACLLYRLVAGYRVFGPRNAAEAADEGMTPQRPGGLSDTQWRALKRALAYPRVTRFDSMAGFLQALDERSEETSDLEIIEDFGGDEPSGSSGWVFGFITLLLLVGFAGYQFGLVDVVTRQVTELMRQLETQDVATVPAQADAEDVAAQADPDNESLAAELQPVAESENDGPSADNVDESGSEAVDVLGSEVVDALRSIVEEGPDINAREIVGSEENAATGFEQDAITGSVEGAAMDAANGPVALNEKTPAVSLIDYSQLPAPDTEVMIILGTVSAGHARITLREDGDPVVVDFIRGANIDVPMILRLDEVGFSGNRSPWVSEQYTMSGDGIVEFPAGQERARITLTMTSDSLREADQQSRLRVTEASNAAAALVILEIDLEDDDRRNFEARLPVNTVGFAVSQISVSERDPAAQIDIVRFNPDDQRIVIGYAVRGSTATVGEDYFAPSGYSVSFGPGERSARLLVPLVQDSEAEGDEVFVVELSNGDSAADVDIYHRIAVVIRDDDVPFN